MDFDVKDYKSPRFGDDPLAGNELPPQPPIGVPVTLLQPVPQAGQIYPNYPVNQQDGGFEWPRQ